MVRYHFFIDRIVHKQKQFDITASMIIFLASVKFDGLKPSAATCKEMEYRQLSRRANKMGLY